MLRRSTALILLTTGTGALLTSAPATALGETCQGQQATIVGTEYELMGTTGDDVIVTGPSAVIYAGAGNDLVCVRSSSFVPDPLIDSGTGDDVVDASAVQQAGFQGVTTQLGTGVDSYIGSPAASDRVVADGADDHVSGADVATLRITGSPVPGQTGTYDVQTLEVLSVDRDVEVDLATRKVIVSGRPAADLVNISWTRAAAPHVTVHGDDEGNHVSATGCDVQIFGNGGNDNLITRLGLAPYIDFDPIEFACEPETTVRGGLGDDLINGAKARDRLFGGAGNDKLVGRSAVDLLVGGSGRDDLSGGRGPDVMRGNAGADTMAGRLGNDTLLGNRGRDRASGNEGTDRCVAERERLCER